jgi:hypothetical protein
MAGTASIITTKSKKKRFIILMTFFLRCKDSKNHKKSTTFAGVLQ